MSLEIRTFGASDSFDELTACFVAVEDGKVVGRRPALRELLFREAALIASRLPRAGIGPRPRAMKIDRAAIYPRLR